MNEFENLKVDENFDENFYEENYPDVKEYFFDITNIVSKRKRLYHHYLNYGKNLFKNKKELEEELLGPNFKVDENFDEKIYEKQNPEIADYFLPAAKLIDKRKRLYHHYLNYNLNKKTNIFLTKKNIDYNLKNKKIKTIKEKIKCKILVKIPSLSRPDRLIRSMESFCKMSYKIEDITFCVSLNKDDIDTNNDDFIKKIRDVNLNAYVFFGDHKNKIEAYNADIENFDFEILILSSDDMEVQKEGYDIIIPLYMSEYFPDYDGVLWFDTQDSEITNTLSIIGKKYYDRFGYVYNEIYNGYYCDDEFTRTAFKLGKLAKIDEKIFKHNILSFCEMPKDVTYLKSLVFGTRDKALYKIRKSVQFDIAECGVCPNRSFSDLFFLDKRNKGKNNWLTYSTKYEEPIDRTELYILENMDAKIADMDYEEFFSFSKNYFRDYRMLIPPIIHQIWFGDLPKEIENMMRTFSEDYISQNPGWRYMFWDEKKIKNLNILNKDIFDQAQKYDSKSDIVRLEILNQFGGWYLDSDFVWLKNKSLSSLLPKINNGFAIAYEKLGTEIGKGFLQQDTTRVANGFMGSTIANPIIAFIMGRLKKSYFLNKSKGSVASTGPDFIQSVIGRLMQDLDISILNHNYFFPVWWCYDEKRNKDYQEHKLNLTMTCEQLGQKYPEAYLYHKGFTSIK